MSRPKGGAGSVVELADIVRAVGGAYRTDHRLCPEQRQALRAIVACRTAELGGHRSQCEACGREVHHYHSCGNRHCPKCQALAKERWVQKRRAELLPVEYFHVVFTLPHRLNRLAQWHPRLVYRLLFQCASRTLLEVGRNPRWLGAELGITAVLHTWGQRLDQHVHLHCIVTGGGLSADKGQWKRAKPHFLFPVRVLSTVFRGKFLEALGYAWAAGECNGDDTHPGMSPEVYQGLLQELTATEWVVYAKPPFAGPEQVIQYLGRYTHRVAIGNHRLLAFNGTQVTFRWRDYAHANKLKAMPLEADEFLRRFLLHVLPKGVQRIRHYGLLANRGKSERLAQARQALAAAPPEPVELESVEQFMRRVLGIDIHRCPHCGVGRLVLVAIIPAQRSPPATGPPGAYA